MGEGREKPLRVQGNRALAYDGYKYPHSRIQITIPDITALVGPNWTLNRQSMAMAGPHCGHRTTDFYLNPHYTIQAALLMPACRNAPGGA